MSMRKQSLGQIPEETIRVARKIFGADNPYVKLADQLGSIYEFEDFIELFPSKGQPAEHPVRLMLATVLQFAEGLSDREAAEAVRARIDWKYLLHLEIEDRGFDHTVFSEFRARLIRHECGPKLLEKLILVAKEKGLIKTRGKQRTDSTHVLAHIRVLNRLELVHETMRNALESLAAVVPNWVSMNIPVDWYDRYSRRLFSYSAPKSEKGRTKLAQTIGADGFELLTLVDKSQDMTWLSEIPAVVTLRQVWSQQYTQPPQPPRFLDNSEQVPAAERISSPHDNEARFSIKKGVEWTGYKVHLTETCDQGFPRLIVNVESTKATTPDSGMLPAIHRALQKKGVLPSDHLADTGYVNTDSLVASERDFGVRVVGPPLKDSSWQAREGGFDKTYFAIDWDAKHVTCPKGRVSKRWTTKKTGHIEVSFNPYDCYRCPFREVCVRGTTTDGHPKARHLSLRPRAEHEALANAREYLKSADTKVLYAERAGIEGTISEAVRECGLRFARYVGLEKVSLQHTLTGIAINFTRLAEWFLETPLAKTRKSHLERLKAA